MTLTLPTQRDPIARMALFALIGVALYLAAYAAPQPAQAEVMAIDWIDPLTLACAGGFVVAAVLAAIINRMRAAIDRQAALICAQAQTIAALEVRHREHDIRLAIGNRQRFEAFKRDGYRCQLCGASAQDGAILEIDHKLARANGGTDEDWNLWTLCRVCNNGKRDLPL